MSPPGRPKGEFRRAQHEGSFVSPHPVAVPATLLDQAQAAYERADHATTVACCLQALAAPRLSQTQRVRAETLRLAALYRQGRLAEVVAGLAQALHQADALHYSTQRLELLRMGSLACGETGRYEDALIHADEAMSLAGDDVVQRVYALNAQASCFERMGDPWQAARLMESALACLVQLPHERPQGWAARSPASMPSNPALAYARLLTCNNLCATQLGMFHILRDAGAPDDARAVLVAALDSATEALALARERGEAWPMVSVEGNLAETQVHLGQPEEALRTLSSALPRALARSHTAQIWALRCTWAQACIALGRAGQALVELDAVMHDIGERQPVSVLLRLHHACYRAHAALGNVAPGLHHLEQYLALERARTSRQLQAQSRVLVTRLEMEQARRQAELARSEARKHRRRADHWADAALHDPLTGLLNRRGLEERIAALSNPQGPLAAVMVDVDHFKRINDRYGHAVGDQVLAQLARLLRAYLRPDDLLARYGGEEFSLLLGGLAREQAVEVCERLRAGVAQEDWSACGMAQGDRVTVSIGLSLSAPGAKPRAGAAVGPDIAALSMAADEALYRAKHLGRNRVECA